MTIRLSHENRRRSLPQPPHTYCIPVVRELPSQPAERFADLTW